MAESCAADHAIFRLNGTLVFTFSGAIDIHPLFSIARSFNRLFASNRTQRYHYRESCPKDVQRKIALSRKNSKKLTAYQEYASDAHAVHPSGCLLKPVAHLPWRSNGKGIVPIVPEDPRVCVKRLLARFFPAKCVWLRYSCRVQGLHADAAKLTAGLRCLQGCLQSCGPVCFVFFSVFVYLLRIRSNYDRQNPHQI